jgi:acyl carrier protein
MENNIEMKIRELVYKNIDMSIPMDEISINDDLTVLGMNSINAIKIIVDIESEYGFEFDDEDLNIDNFRTLNNLVSYVKSRI